MIPDTTHRPDAQFREQLEWEVARAFRRRRRLAASQRARSLNHLRAAAIVVVSVALGASATLASAQIRTDARRDSLLDAARADATLAAARVQIARAELAEVSRKVQVGAAGASEERDAQTDLRAMEAQAARAQYNIEEITAGSQAPRDDLTAPLVGGRDFVKDRLQLDLMVAQQLLTKREAARADAERRARLGAGSEVAQLEAESAVSRARANLAVLAERLTLRQEFLQRGTSAEVLARKLNEFQVKQDVMVVQSELSAARARLDLVERQQRVGAASDVDLLRAQLEVKQRELDLQQLGQRLQRMGAIRDEQH
jgi:hypothetical protein